MRATMETSTTTERIRPTHDCAVALSIAGPPEQGYMRFEMWTLSVLDEGVFAAI